MAATAAASASILDIAALGAGMIISVAAMLAQQKRTFLFDPAAKKLTWTSHGLFKSAAGVISFDEISDVRIESHSDSKGTSYRAALVTPSGSMPLSTAYIGNEKKVAEYAASIIALLGRDPTKPINVVDEFGRS